MNKLPTVDKLKEAINIAEKTLEDIQEERIGNKKHKKKRIEASIDKAYGILNNHNYTEKEIEKCTNDIWVSMMDDDHFIALLIFFFGFVLAGISILVVYRAYTFINNKVPTESVEDFPQGDISNLVDVEYKESIIRLTNMIATTDEMGLDNLPHEFTIENNSKKITDANYAVNYSVNIMPMNNSTVSLIDKKYIKYKYIYTNSWSGKTYESKIGTLEELPIDKNGNLILMTGTQLKNASSKFKVIFWLSSDAPTDQQNAEYTFRFKIEASIVQL